MAARLPSDAFQFYFSLGAGRSYQAVARHFGVAKTTVTNRATKENWQRRVEELEAKARQAAEEKAVESLEQVNSRHLKALRVIQGKALEALRSMPISSAMDAVRALDLSIKQERIVLGEPGDRTAVSVEETIKGEYDRWMTIAGEPGDEDAPRAESR